MCVVTFDWEECDAKKKFELFDKKRLLTWAVVELTEQCNFNCIWCYANSSHKGQHMSKENAEKLLNIIANSGIKQITFSGGEPLLYTHLKDVIKIARDYGFIIHMNTNGYFLTKRLANELRDLGLTQVQINIDSIDPRKHDKIRGKRGSFDKAVKALKNARAVGLTCVSQTVLTKENEGEIVDIFKFARSIGIQRCRVWDMIPVGRAIEKIDLRPTNYINTLNKLAEFGYKTGGKNIESGDPLFPQDHKTNLNISGGYCVAMAGVLINISYKGDVYFCVTQRKSMFNVFKEINNGNTLEKFYNSKLKEYLQSFKPLSKCFKCDFLKKCKGGCPSRRKYNRLDVDYWCNISKNVQLHL
jgi:radical SAM protein with 4Fe4S-binding SPASM domain